jgi:hypothetical protein
MQQRHAALFAVQQSRQGIITEVSHRLQDLDRLTAASTEHNAARPQTANTTDRAAAPAGRHDQAASSSVGKQPVRSRWSSQRVVMQQSAPALAAVMGTQGGPASSSSTIAQTPACDARKLQHSVQQVPLVVDQHPTKAGRKPSQLAQGPHDVNAMQDSSEQQKQPCKPVPQASHGNSSGRSRGRGRGRRDSKRPAC